ELTKAIVDRTNLPVTVKTRLGWDDNTKYIEEVAERLQDVGIKALSIHGRTRKQMYKGEADWTLIGRIKDNPRISIPIFGNGDIDTPQKAEAYRNRYGVDGIMIGRAAIGNPWIFREIKHYFATGEILPPPSIDERVDAARDHLKRSIDWKGAKLGILEMRRHYTNYFRGLRGVKEYRKTLVSEYEPELLFNVLEEMREVYRDLEVMV
ncbi:MAG: tRNA-dihydrouridine synthase, partial [Bacteroidota bacterium]